MKKWLLILIASLAFTTFVCSAQESKCQNDLDEDDYLSAVDSCAVEANNGDITAQRQLGWIYSQGIGGISRDGDKSITWYRKAADQGDAYAMYNLALQYHIKGNEHSFITARRWFEKASKAGYHDADYFLALYYLNAAGGYEFDLSKAKSLLKPLVLKDDPDAVELYVEAITSYEDALQVDSELQDLAARGVEEAEQFIIFMEVITHAKDGSYFYKQNFPNVLSKIEAAQRNSSRMGGFTLGYMYLNGLMVEKDLEQAYYIFSDTCKHSGGINVCLHACKLGSETSCEFAQSELERNPFHDANQ